MMLFMQRKSIKTKTIHPESLRLHLLLCVISSLQTRWLTGGSLLIFFLIDNLQNACAVATSVKQPWCIAILIKCLRVIRLTLAIRFLQRFQTKKKFVSWIIGLDHLERYFAHTHILRHILIIYDNGCRVTLSNILTHMLKLLFPWFKLVHFF